MALLCAEVRQVKGGQRISRDHRNPLSGVKPGESLLCPQDRHRAFEAGQIEFLHGCRFHLQMLVEPMMEWLTFSGNAFLLQRSM